MNNKSTNSFKKAITPLLEAFKEVILIIPHIVRDVVKSLNKRLRFSITFKTTTLHTFSLLFALLFNTLLIVGGIFGLLVYQDYQLMNRSITTISEKITRSESVPEDRLIEMSKDYALDISVFNKDKKLYFTTSKGLDLEYYNSNHNGFSMHGDNNSAYTNMSKKIGLSDDIYYLQLNKSIMDYLNILIIALSVVTALHILTVIGSAIKLSRTTKKMLKPINNMTNTAKSISANVLDKRLDVVQSHDELKDLAETFNDMLDRIQKSYEQQNQFVSDASHELRTPIAVIQGYANMLNRWGKDDRAVLEESIAAIASEAENMKDLVEKLLFLARTDKNTQKIEKDEFPLNELIDEVLRETRMIDTKHLITCKKNDPVIIDADRALIKQVLRVLIDNSIKYTPENGLITINSINNFTGIVLIVQDNGIGMSPEDLPRIFDRFYRCDKARTRQTGGTGLGLSIAKWIIGSHNGSIEVESALNVGTKFIIKLPYN